MKGKKFLSAIVVGAMVLCTMSVSVFAEYATTIPSADENGVITLTENVQLASPLTITADTTIDLAGFNITSADVADAEATLKTLIDVDGATLTIKGPGVIEPGSRTNITNYNNSFYTISAKNGASVIIDGATVKGSKGINTKYGGTAVNASRANVTIQNGAKIYGGDCEKNGITSSNYTEFTYTYQGEAGDAVSAWNSPLTITDAEIYGGNGTADADTQTSYVGSGANFAAGGLGIYVA